MLNLLVGVEDDLFLDPHVGGTRQHAAVLDVLDRRRVLPTEIVIQLCDEFLSGYGHGFLLSL